MNKILKILIFILLFFLLIFFIFSFKFLGKNETGFIKKDGKFIKLKEGFYFIPFKKVYSFKNKFFKLNYRGKLYTIGYDEINSSIQIKYKLKEEVLPFEFNLKEIEKELENSIIYISTCLYPEEFYEKNFKEKLILFLKDKPFEVLDFKGRFDEKDIKKANLRLKEIEKKKKEPIFTLFLGLDALDWNILNPLLQSGKCPNFKKLIENGTYGEILSEEPMLSPILWTTIATGKSPEKHKILEFTQKNEEGEEIPITSNSRRCKALWNILSEGKRNVAFLCWWVTDPPEWVKGVLISDRLSYQLFGFYQNHQDFQKFLSPFSETKLNLKLLSAKDIKYEEIKKIINVSKEEYEKAWKEFEETRDPHKNRINHLRAILASTLNIHKITIEILKNGNFSLVAPYFEGTDTVAHRFAQFMPPKLEWVSNEEYEKYKDALFNFYILMDNLIGNYLKLIPENSVIFISSDHGFQSGTGRPNSNPEDMVLGAPQWHRKLGVYIISGKNVKKGKGDMVSIKDIAPTILYLQGMPVPEDMEGKVLEGALSNFIIKEKIECIKTYETLKERPRFLMTQGKKDLEERLKELKALGYITGKTEEKEKGKDESFTYYYNLANSYKFQGKRDLAKFNYKKAIEVNPSFGLGYFELASLLSGEGDHKGAYENLKKALEVGKAVPSVGCIYLIDEALKSGNLKEGFLFLENLGEKYKNDAPYYTALGISLFYLRDLENSKNYFKKAFEIDPFEVYAIEETLKNPYLKMQQLAFNKIKEAMGKNLEKEKNLKLGKLCFEAGFLKEAKFFIEKIYKNNPEDPEILYLMGSLKVLEKRFDEGFSFFEKALKIEPYNPSILFNYGASLINSGKLEKGYILLQKAKEVGYNNPVIYIALGKAAFRLNKKNEAENYLKEALKYNETNKEAEELLKTLK